MATETGEATSDASDDVDESDFDTGEGGDLDADDEPYSQYQRSVIVTTCATLLGIAAGIASALYGGDPQGMTGLLIVFAAVVVQFPFYRLIGMDVDDFGMKGQIYIFFMTFVLWFISWSLILTTGAL